MHVTKHLAACALAAVTGLGLSSQVLADASASDYETMMRAAKAAQKTADDAGGEWRDVGEMLEAAEKAAAAGDYTKASALANQARQQSELGYTQALAEKNAGIPDYMK